MFDFRDLREAGVIIDAEWFNFCMEYILAKAATFAAHPILDHRPDHTEMFWFLPELSTESDLNENGTFILTCLNTLISANMDNGMISDGSRDVSPTDDTANDHQGGSRDVSPPDDADSDRQGTLSQPGDADLHGDKERRQEDKEVTQLCITAHVHSAAC